MAKEFNIKKWQDKQKQLSEQGFDDRLKSMMGDDDFEKATNPELAKLINNAIMSIDPNMSYRDFAKGVAQVLIDEYSVQNYEPFISELKKVLDSTLGEANVTGTGASFNAGSGEGYMSPYAFGDNKRKKRKAYMGYKEI